MGKYLDLEGLERLKTKQDKTYSPISHSHTTSEITNFPTIGNGTITITQNGTTKGTFTTNQTGNTTIALTDNNTTYSTATTSSNGLMSSSDKSKLDGIASSANAYTHPSYTSKSSGLYKVTVDSTGHVSGTTAVAKTDITALGIPSQDTTYSTGTTSTSGLTKLYTSTGTATDGTMTQSAIKSSLDGKANSSHTHNYAGSSSAGGAATTALACTGNAATATKLATARTIALTGSVTGSGSFDGSGNLSITTSTNHTHSYLPLSGGTVTGATTFNSTVGVASQVNIGNCSLVYDTTNKCLNFVFS